MDDINSTVFKVEPGKQEVVVTHVFNASRRLVFETFIAPEHIPNWWGPGNLKTFVEKMEIKEGGIWRFIQTDLGGEEYAFHGVFHEISGYERIINTFEFEGLPERGHVILETKKFDELPGDKTKLTIQSVYQSTGDRDGMVNSGMEGGMRESMERLEALLVKKL